MRKEAIKQRNVRKIIYVSLKEINKLFFTVSGAAWTRNGKLRRKKRKERVDF